MRDTIDPCQQRVAAQAGKFGCARIECRKPCSQIVAVTFDATLVARSKPFQESDKGIETVPARRHLCHGFGELRAFIRPFAQFVECLDDLPGQARCLFAPVGVEPQPVGNCGIQLRLTEFHSRIADRSARSLETFEIRIGAFPQDFREQGARSAFLTEPLFAGPEFRGFAQGLCRLQPFGRITQQPRAAPHRGLVFAGKQTREEAGVLQNVCQILQFARIGFKRIGLYVSGQAFAFMQDRFGRLALLGDSNLDHGIGKFAAHECPYGRRLFAKGAQRLDQCRQGGKREGRRKPEHRKQRLERSRSLIGLGPGPRSLCRLSARIGKVGRHFWHGSEMFAKL